jgi:putative ABC transport system ATP-binding protein
MPEVTDPVVWARGLGLRYGPSPALHDVTLGVRAREVVAFVGPSGSGKTTLLLCLCGLLLPDEGTVGFGETTLNALSERDRDRLRRKSFGFVFQFGDLVPELTIGENVALPLRLQGITRRDSARRAVEQLEVLGIGHLANRRVGEVSGGEMQRAAISRALVHQPAVVFADEPTGALDEDNRDLVLDQLLIAAATAGTAVALVTHDRSIASRAERIVTLRNGTVST